MTDASSSLNGILDIAPPVAPAALDLQQGITFGLFIFLALGSALLLGTLLWRYRLSQRGKARRQLTRLRKSHQHQRIGSHAATFRLAAILRQGLRLTHISHSSVLPAPLQTQQARWHEFSERLALARYAPGEIDTEQLQQLIKESRFWLRVWP
jgi:hypothetical protein